MNDPAAKTFNSLIEAEKALITRCVIPLLCARRDSLNRKMDRSDNVVVDFDLTPYDALQPNKTQISTWVNAIPVTQARKLEIMGEDVPETMTEEERNLILVPSGMVPLADLMMGPADDITNDVNALDAEGANPYNNE
jgi:hypothetical protein